MKKIIAASLLASVLTGCVSVYELPGLASAPACLCGKDSGDDVIYRVKNGRWYRLRDGICPCVDRR